MSYGIWWHVWLATQMHVEADATVLSSHIRQSNAYRSAQCVCLSSLFRKVFLSIFALVSHAHHVTKRDRKVTVAGTEEMLKL